MRPAMELQQPQHQQQQERPCDDEDIQDDEMDTILGAFEQQHQQL